MKTTPQPNPPDLSLLLQCVSLISVSVNFVDLVKIKVLRAHELVASDPIKKIIASKASSTSNVCANRKFGQAACSFI